MSSDPVRLGEALESALRHHQAGRLGEAEALYRRILRENPRHAEALHLLGALASQVGRGEAAVDLIRQALAIEPNFPEAWSNLGKILLDLRRTDEAIGACRQAIAIAPQYADGYSKLGMALREQGQIEEAIAAFRQAINLTPEHAEAWCNLGIALGQRSRVDEAKAAYRQAIALNPGIAEAYYNLGGVLRDVGEHEEAMAAFRKAVELRPSYVEAHSSLIYTLFFHPGYDGRRIAEELGGWNRQHAEPLKRHIVPHGNSRDPERRLRIGYVSADFNGHASALFLEPLLRSHDRTQFDIFCYAQVSKPDAWTRRFQTMSTGWMNTAGVSDEAVAEQIRRDGIDILVDLKLHTTRNRLLVLARKPAPVQATWLGYPGSTGLTTVDYRLSDPYLDPPGGDETIYSERTMRLPETFWCFDPLDERDLEVNALPAKERGVITFGSLNSFCKVNEELLRVWAEVLRAVEGARLVLLAAAGAHRQRVVERLAREGVDGGRVEFVASMSRREYLRQYHRIDVGLDTYPCNGHTTTLESLWMGVPVVTRLGPTAMGRAGWSQLNNLGLAELAGETAGEFVRIAVGLAKDMPRLEQLRATLRGRMEASPLMDERRFARNMEAAYRQMWRTWCAGNR
jgi:protein O-GlcNAc transferase